MGGAWCGLYFKEMTLMLRGEQTLGGQSGGRYGLQGR